MRDEPDEDDPDEVETREAARIRRRDHDARASQRALLRPGMGKVFKQIQDRQQRSAEALRREEGARHLPRAWTKPRRDDEPPRG